MQGVPVGFFEEAFSHQMGKPPSPPHDDDEDEDDPAERGARDPAWREPGLCCPRRFMTIKAG